ncbi:hypothetical protein V6U81_28850, partial [Micromonospora sp. CPCC 205711]
MGGGAAGAGGCAVGAGGGVAGVKGCAVGVGVRDAALPGHAGGAGRLGSAGVSGRRVPPARDGPVGCPGPEFGTVGRRVVSAGVGVGRCAGRAGGASAAGD